MGTRSLTCVVKNGEFKVAQYGQWDGYPSGSGVHILNFLKGLNGADELMFAANVASCGWITPEAKTALWNEIGVETPDDPTESFLVSSEDSERFCEEFPHLHRDTGSNILEYILRCPNLLLTNSIDFAADGLFCEWCYVIDLDNRTLEVYTGFNKDYDVLEGRFAEVEAKGINETTEYTPVTLVATYSLNDLPSDEDFVAQLEEEEDEAA